MYNFRHYFLFSVPAGCNDLITGNMLYRMPVCFDVMQRYFYGIEKTLLKHACTFSQHDFNEGRS